MARSKDDEYREFAIEAQRQADLNQGEAKARWLQIAQGWLSLISKPKQTPEQTFDADSKSMGTGQDDSAASH